MTAYLKVGLLLFMFLVSCGSPGKKAERKTPHGVMTDGQYDVVFAEDFADSFENFTLKITGNRYEKKFSSDSVVKGQLERLPRTLYIFHDDGPVDTTSVFYGLGDEIMELTSIQEDTTEFRTVFATNLNVILNEGIIVRKDE